MKVGIIGIGAIGSVISFSLDETNELYYFNRSNRESITVSRAGNLATRAIELSSYDDKLNLDWLIICLKEYHISAAISSIVKLIHTDLKIAVIRNGLELKAPYDKYLDPKNIVECIIDCPTQYTPNGHYLQLRKPQIKTSSNRYFQEFEALFSPNQVDISSTRDFHTETWKKIIESSALGGILAYYGKTCAILEDIEILDMFKKVLDECIAVAIADGAKIESNFRDRLIEKTLNYPDDKGSSMLSDKLLGRPIEWNAKNGIIVRVGKHHGINTEMNNTLLQGQH